MNCGLCQYWAKRPADPMNLSISTGECRNSPPQMIMLPTPAGIQISVAYPILPDNFPACGQYKPNLRIDLGEPS